MCAFSILIFKWFYSSSLFWYLLKSALDILYSHLEGQHHYCGVDCIILYLCQWNKYIYIKKTTEPISCHLALHHIIFESLQIWSHKCIKQSRVKHLVRFPRSPKACHPEWTVPSPFVPSSSLGDPLVHSVCHADQSSIRTVKHTQNTQAHSTTLGPAQRGHATSKECLFVKFSDSFYLKQALLHF